MALVLADRVQETTTTTGTGTITLAGAVSGFQTFTTAIGNANTTYYTIAGQTTSEFEVGIGTYTTSGTTLSRDTILTSSNSNLAVNFSAGTKNVFVTYPASRSVYVNGTTLTATNSSILPVGSGGTGITTTPTNGQIPIGNGTNYTAATLTAGNGTSITNASGAITVTGTGSTLNPQTSAYVLVAGDAGKTISITTGGVTVNTSIFSAGNIVTIYNNSGSSQTITQGTSVTMQFAGQTSSQTGNRTLGLYGLASLVFISASNVVISGAGLT